MKNKKEKNIRRKIRTRAKVQGTKERPRLSVFRSTRYFYAQVIDDEKAITLVSVSEKELDKDKKFKKIDKAKELGFLLGKKALKKNIKAVRLDRGSYRFHGRVKAFAQGAREGGLQF